MNSFQPPGGSTRRCVVDRLDRLLTTIEGLGQRLREGLARALSETVSGAIHEAISRVLTGRPPVPVYSYSYSPREFDPFDRDYDRPYDPDYDREKYEYDRRWEESPRAKREPETTAEPIGASANRWQMAILAGLQAMAYWLHERPGGRALLSALGVGAVVGTMAYIIGPLFGAVSAAAGAMLALLALADGSRLGISRLRQAIAAG